LPEIWSDRRSSAIPCKERRWAASVIGVPTEAEDIMRRNPLETDPTYEQRVRERAYRLWESEGKPHGRDVEFWERARELIGMEESSDAAKLPNPAKRPRSRRGTGIEEAEIQQNLGEFPGALTDQGDEQAAPAVKRRSRRKQPK
jgi:hypothetical protein